jgi:hypothetical protein
MGTMNWERIEKWEYIAAHVADEYHKKYNMVEREDIKQSLYEWFVSHPRKLTEWEKLGNRSGRTYCIVRYAIKHWTTVNYGSLSLLGMNYLTCSITRQMLLKRCYLPSCVET